MYESLRLNYCMYRNAYELWYERKVATCIYSLYQPYQENSDNHWKMCTVLCIQCRNCIRNLKSENAQDYAQRHRVGRVLCFFSSRRKWDSPNPSPAGECAPSPRFWGEGYTRWRERGWKSPNSDEGTFTVVLFIYTYFVPRDLNEIVRSWIRLLLYNKTACLLQVQ